MKDRTRRLFKIIKKTIRLFSYIVGAALYFSSLYKLIIYLRRHNAKVLVYHDVGDRHNLFIKDLNISVDTEVFRRHLAFVTKHYKVVSLTNLLTGLGSIGQWDRHVAITFDDGYKTILNNAYPALHEFRCTATVFLIGHCVLDSGMMWRNLAAFKGILSSSNIASSNDRVTNNNQMGQNLRLNKIDLDAHFGESSCGISEPFYTSHDSHSSALYLNLQECRILSDAGFCFGNHSYNHLDLSALSVKELATEIRVSLGERGEGIDYHGNWLAAPFGKPISADSLSGLKKLGISPEYCFLSNGIDNNWASTATALGRHHLLSRGNSAIFTEMEILPLMRRIARAANISFTKVVSITFSFN
jgi:peptidoglycan/xylan/chitin deacetylase (PgdA/CDA1 family)